MHVELQQHRYLRGALKGDVVARADEHSVIPRVAPSSPRSVKQ
jgi:hypothetical protein